MVTMQTFESREEWLKARAGRIGGSDASAVVGLNPYMDNVTLWKIKTGQLVQEDISEKPYVKYGTEAEQHLRALFALDFPEYEVGYQENNMFLNDKYPWGHYSADGWLRDQEGRFGILEIKTTEILRSMQKEKWKGRVPDNYYCQLLHAFLITGASFCVLKAQLKFDYDGEIVLHTRHYKLERSDALEDIKYLEHSEKTFWEQMQEGKPPALKLPDL